MSEEKRDKWEMPKPVFRQTSGSLPKGFVKKEVSWDDSTAPGAAAPDSNNDMLITMYAPPGELVEKSEFESEVGMEPAAAKDFTAAIEPQPSISEQFTIDEAVVQPEAKVKGKRGGIGKVFLSLGILILLAVAAGIGALIYYFYFTSSAENNNF